jgi:hypothetical protein
VGADEASGGALSVSFGESGLWRIAIGGGSGSPPAGSGGRQLGEEVRVEAVRESAVDYGDVKAAVANPALSRAAEAIWVTAQRSVWSSLVIVPAEAALTTAPIARAVAAVAAAQRGEAVEYLDLGAVALADSRPLAEKLADKTRSYCHVVAVGCPLESQTALLLASSADAAILVVARERTLLASARRVLELVGSSRFLGAVVLSGRLK